MRTRWIVVLGLAMVVLASVALIQGRSAADEPPAGEAVAGANTADGLLLHVSHGVDDPHRLLMAFRMAGVVAESGRPVLVYCDIKAVGLLTKDAPDVTLEPFPGAKESLRNMLAKGVRVRACPTCLKVAGFSEADLVEGVKLADRDEFFSFTEGRILTLDY